MISKASFGQPGPRTAGLVLCLGMAIFAGCELNQGHGHLSGTINVAECSFPKNQKPKPWLSANNTTDFVMDSKFVVGEPLDANPLTAPGFPANQMIIRVQNSGHRIEAADALLFWVQDSAAVARCINGTDDVNPVVCDRSPASQGTKGEGRMYVGMTSEAVFSSFVLNGSCPSALISADALGACVDGSCPDVSLCPGRGSWIQFSQFGHPVVRVNSNDQTRYVDDSFKVSDGEPIAATSFHVELCDIATVEAKLTNTLPIPPPSIVGTLDGEFDFDLERRLGSQPFP